MSSSTGRGGVYGTSDDPLETVLYGMAALQPRPGGHVLDHGLPRDSAVGLWDHLPGQRRPQAVGGTGAGRGPRAAGRRPGSGPRGPPAKGPGPAPGGGRSPLGPGRNCRPARGRRRGLPSAPEQLPHGPGRSHGWAGEPGLAGGPGPPERRPGAPADPDPGREPGPQALGQLRGLPAAGPAGPEPREHGSLQRGHGECLLPGEGEVPPPGCDPAAQVDLPAGPGAPPPHGHRDPGGHPPAGGLPGLWHRQPGAPSWSSCW